MLSVGSRGDGSNGTLGFGAVGVEMQENELEEGEACSGSEDDAATIDPETDLSYIDAKIQNVLGHLQKDFEGGLCAENLGAKFGGYGSFLPSYQRSPSILSHSKSPQKIANSSTMSPYYPSFEGAHQRTNTPTSASTQYSNSRSAMTASKYNSSSAVPPLDNPFKKDICEKVLNAYCSSSPGDLISKQPNCDKKSLKVRVRVGSDSGFRRNNASIYSGLGLDFSPSPSQSLSTEGSPDVNQGSSPELSGSRDDSPMTTYQFYTCVRVLLPGSYLLSPLPKNLLCMIEKETPFKDVKVSGHMLGHIISDMSLEDIVPGMNAKYQFGKNKKFVGKKPRTAEAKNFNNEDGECAIGVVLRKEIDINASSGTDLVSDTFNAPLLSNSKIADEGDRKGYSETIKGSSVNLRPGKFTGKDRVLSNDLANGGQPENTTTMGTNKLGSSGIESLQLREKLGLKEVDKLFIDVPKDEALADTKKDGKGASDKDIDVEKSSFEGYKDKNYHFVGPAESVKMKAPQKVTSIGQNEGKEIQGKAKAYVGKGKSEWGQNNGTSFGGSLNENSKSALSVTLKEKKKSSLSRGEVSDCKSNVFKSHKNPSKILNTDCQRNDSALLKVEHGDTRYDDSEVYSREKPKDLELEYDKTRYSEKINEGPGKKKIDIFPAETVDKVPQPATLTVNVLTSEVVPQPSTTVFIEEWVCCDSCEKWRLLPYGTNPDHLPKKWLCSMLNWLPGMNKCNFSEEETTKALHALYHLPVPEGPLGASGHHDIAHSSITYAESLLHPLHDSMHPNVPGVAKKRPTVKKVSIVRGSPHMTNFVEDNHQTSFKSRSLSDVNQFTFEPNLPSKSGLLHTSKSIDFTAEIQKSKQKEKHRSYQRHSDGGNPIDQNGKQLKSKSKYFDQETMINSKKTKTCKSEYATKNYEFNIDTEQNNALDGPSPEVAGKFLQKIFTSKVDCNDTSPISGKKSKASVIKMTGNGKAKEYSSSLGTEKLESVMKRKVKGQQDSQIYSQNPVVDIKEEASETDVKREKKARISKTEGRELSANKIGGKREKQPAKFLLSCNREKLSNGFDGHRGSLDKVDQLTQTNMCNLDLIKRDPGYVQLSAAATSSSSKVSGSWKSKTNIQEARNSPVDSVSSSPLRISNMDKVTDRKNLMRKDDAINASFSVMGSPKRGSDGEVDGSHDQVNTDQNGKSMAANCTVMDSMRERHDIESRENGWMPITKAKDLLFSKIFGGMDDQTSPPNYEEVDGGACGADISEKANKSNDLLRGKDQNLVEEQPDSSYGINAPNGHRKSGKISSRSSERRRTSNIDISKGKRKVSDSYSDQEGFCPVNDTIGFHGHSVYNGLRVKKPCIREEERKKIAVKAYNNLLNDCKRDDNHSIGIQEKVDFHGSSLPVGRQTNAGVRDFSNVSGNDSRFHLKEDINMTVRENEKLSKRSQLDRADKVEAGGRINLVHIEHKVEKSNSQNRPNQVSRAVPTLLNRGNSEALPTETAGVDADKVVNHQSRKPENQNGCYQSNSRNTTSNRSDGSVTLRKESGLSAATVLKDARDLKHKANRLKGEGLEHESTGLYFQAALKFLRVALLLEHSNSENGKQSDMTATIQMYSETAKLCEFCAHEYEKSKEMSAAALAYKCMEVAYLKVVFFKNSNASKDRHELQITPQMSLHGESPSSSASDIDNLHNQCILDKAAAVKRVNSPQVSGNHVIPARSRPTFMRLLGFAEDVNSAMEASRKSLSAFASASVTLEAAHDAAGITSVKQVLDFSFHDVEGLLRLVRLSMEHISC